jgi:zinc transport system substrate-binding protein
MRRVWTIALAAFLISPAWTQTLAQAASEKKRVKAFVSVMPQAYFVEQVGGSLVKVDVLVAPGQSPHTFEPTPKQMAKLAGAEIYFGIGMPFEAQLLKKVIATNKRLRIIDTTQGLKLGGYEQPENQAASKGNDAKEEFGADVHAEAERDPHIWLNPRPAKAIAANICEGLKAADPIHAPDYEKNLKILQLKLDELDAKLAEALEPLRGKKFMVFHPAFGHFGAAYGLKQVAVEIEGKEPSAKQLAQLIDWAKKEGVKVIFVQAQFSSKNAEAVAKAIGGVVVPMDPLARDYIKNLEDMAGKIQNALGAKQ